MLGKLHVTNTDRGIERKGTIATRTTYCEFRLEPILDRKDANSPHYDVMAISDVHGKEYHAGVAWEKDHPEHGKYFSLALDEEQKSIVAGEVKGSNGEFTLRYFKEKNEERQAA